MDDTIVHYLGGTMVTGNRTGADPVVEDLYRLIRTGELGPGEHIEQRTMAERLNVSRTPLREALRVLAADGVIIHSHNQGYVVAKLSGADLLEMYAVRAFLEGELIRTLVWPESDIGDELRELNEECIAAANEGDVERLQAANRKFYFTIYKCSPLNFLILEAQRIWRVSEPYRAVLLANSEVRGQLGAKHKEIIAAVEARDRETLMRLIENRRSYTIGVLLDSLRISNPEAHRLLPQTAAWVASPQEPHPR